MCRLSTSTEVKFHSLAVFFQIQQWKGSQNRFVPVKWGWRESGTGLVPIQTDLSPAPDELLRVVGYNCKIDCSSTRCLCRKRNMKCSHAFINCRRSGCVNSEVLVYAGKSRVMRTMTLTAIITSHKLKHIPKLNILGTCTPVYSREN